MQRAPVVIAATSAGLAAVLSFQTHAPAAQTTAATAGASSATSTTSRTSTSTASGEHTATGAAISTQYGNAQVKVTVTNGRITDVEAIQLQNNDPHSAQISSYAAPLLRQSALAKQSADIDFVSGATYTSTSYQQSLQSALDKLGFTGASTTSS